MTENQEAVRVSDLLRQASSSARKARPRLERRRRPQRLPLSYAQQRLWFIDQMESGSPEYNMPEALRLRGKLNCEALQWTINMIVERHEVLRTHFLQVDGDPVQMIEPTLRISVPLEDLTGLGTEAKQEAVQEAMRREVQEPFNLSRGPLLRVRLLRLDMEDHILLRTVHHILSDGWSQGVFNREFAMLYPAYGQSGAHLPEELPVQYADYALWQRTWLAEEMESGLAYWKKQLEGMPERLELPFDRMPQKRMLVAESYRATFTPEQMAGLKHLSTENRATPYMTMLAGFAVLLSRHSGQDDIVVGSPIANRQDPQLEGLIGCFVNSLVMRVRLKPEMSFRNLLAEVRTMALEAYQHQDLPFARLVEELAPKRSLNATPIFQVSFAQRNAPWEPQKLGGLEITPVGEAQVGAHYDLDVHAWFRGAGAEILWLYNRNVFDPWRIEQMAAQYVRILDAVMADAGSQLAALPLLSSDERRQILGRWNETVRAIAEETLPALFEEQVAKTPEGIALVYEDQQLSYAELNIRANQIARYLIARRVGPEDLVGICMERLPEMIAAILGVLKAGASYLPLDAESPVERLSNMVEDVRPRLVFTTAVHTELGRTVEIVRIGGDAGTMQEAIGQYPARNPVDAERVCRLDPKHPAYVIFTSGSTGKPKSVVVSHAALVNHMRWMAWMNPLGPGDAVLQRTSITFDASVWELFAPLLCGARLVLAAQGTSADPAAIVAMARRFHVSVMQLVPSLLSELLHVEELRECETLAHVFSGGEALPRDLQQNFFGKSVAALYNLYGPTETTIQATWAKCSREGEDQGIGRPIWNTRVYVLDGHLEPAPWGVPGQLYIAGSGVARGYLNRPGLTAERFVADPYGASGSRMYATGDLVCWRPTGTLHYLGRMDRQEKVRGFRVEMGEIESTLRQQPGVCDAAAMVHQDESGEKRLIAYIVAAAGTTLDVSDLRRQLGRMLPDYMVPSAIMTLDALPRMPNGKVDRRSLPAPQYALPSSRAPRTPEEEILCALFAEVLGLQHVGIDDNFFALGGHSLMATRLVSRIRATLEMELAIRAVFESPSVRQISERLREGSRERARLERQQRPERLPLSYAQQQLWFIDQQEGRRSTEYNIAEALRLKGELDRKALERAIHTIVERHEILRTRFAVMDGEPVQLIEPQLCVNIPFEDLSRLQADAREEAVHAAMRRELQEPFDLAQGPLLRLKILKVEVDEHVLLRTLHHIVCDGWSQGIFNQELMALYAAYREARENPLSPLPVQYADFTLWQRRWLEGCEMESLLAYWKQQLAGMPPRMESLLAYWKQQLAGMPPRLELPADRVCVARAFAADVVQMTLPSDQVAALKRLSHQNQTTLYMTLVAGLALLLSRYSGQDDIVIGAPIANRQDARLEEMIGFFVNSLALRVRLKPDMSLRALLAQVRQTALEAYQHQDLPFARLVQELSPQRTVNTTPIFQVQMVLQNAPLHPLRLEGLQVELMKAVERHVRFDLEIHVIEQNSNLLLIWLYKRGLFDSWRIEQMARHFSGVLEMMVKNAN